MVPLLRAALFILICCLAQNCTAGVFDKGAFGYRLGMSLNTNDRYYRQYELFAGAKPLEERKLPGGWTLEPFLDVTCAIQTENGDRGPKLSISGELFFFSPERKWSFTAGLGVGLLTETKIGSMDYGGHVFFLGNVGMSYWFSPVLGIGYRYHHESNGSIYGKNPSVNMHMLDVRVVY